MAAKTRTYAVEDTKDSSITLVEASTPAQARGHCARGQYKASVATQQQLIKLVSAGAKVEIAGDDDEPPAPSSDTK